MKKSALRLLTYYLLLTDRNLSIRQIFTGLCSLTDDVQKEDFNDWLELGQHAPPARASNPNTTGSKPLRSRICILTRHFTEGPDHNWPRFGVFLVDFCGFGSPLWNNENKSCLNDTKFWEVSGNIKLSKFWKLQLSTLQMFAGIYRDSAGVFCNICRENPVIFTGFPCNFCNL